jgi:hypothetical protein
VHIEKAAELYHWFQIADDGVVELFLDHHALQTFRMCEASFELSMMANIKSGGRNWNLDFGIAFHTMVERFYVAMQKESFDLNAWLTSAVTLWHESEMHYHEDHKMYKVLGGVHGFVAMMGQYAEHFAKEVDRLRVIGIEITFGKKREVPLGEFYGRYDNGRGWDDIEVRCYLTGRMDLLVDNGSAIGPMDHKTSAFFKGNPTGPYDPQEGMTGYVYAARHIVQKNFPELAAGRKVDRIWMNFGQVTPNADAMERFKRVPLFKTDFQLEQYRLRQLRTFHKIYDMITLGEQPDWNTAVCSNFFHTDCQFKNLHRQNSSSGMFAILNQDFKVAEPWNPDIS